MARMSKLDRMAEVQSQMETADSANFEEIAGLLQDAATAAEMVAEILTEVGDAMGEAQGSHEAREWEARNDALEGANDRLEELDEHLTGLQSIDAALVEHVEAAVNRARAQYVAASEHMDHLMEA